MTALTILGRGKAGRALAAALGCPNLSREARPEGHVILAVPDHAIESLARHFPGRAAHLSGSLHLADVPAAHPLISFDGHPADWRGVPLALTGPVPAAIRDALTSLGFEPFSLPPEQKARYHAAAVLTSGHAATLWIGAARLLRDAGIELPGDGLLPLARATCENLARHGESGRTGPFVRGDEATIKRDAEALPEVWRSVFLDLGHALDRWSPPPKQGLGNDSPKPTPKL
ncbi:MAG: DUF2520 domain-containing protein [Myxococcota bacterium]